VRLGAALCALLAGAPPLGAQDASLLLGASHVRYADSLNGTAGALGVHLGLGRGLRALTLDGTSSRFTSGEWAVQGSGQVTALWPIGSRGVLIGLAGGGAVNDFQDGIASGTAAGGPLLAFRTRRAQIVVGASGGAFRTIDGLWSPIASGSVRGYWALARGVTIDAGASGSLADSVRFADFTGQIRFAVSRLRGGLLVGARAGDLADRPWWSADLAWDVATPVTLEASAGRYPQDITGFTDGVYAQGGLRIYALRRSTPLARPAGLVVERVDARHVRLRIRYRRAVETLQIAGDWNGWMPTRLTPRGSGEWVIELALAPGSYQYALVAGDDWVLPDGVVGVDDGFGGPVARLLVGGG